MFQNICGILSGSLVDFSEFVWTVIPLMMFQEFYGTLTGSPRAYCGILSGSQQGFSGSLVDFSGFFRTAIPVMMFQEFYGTLTGSPRAFVGFFRIAVGFSRIPAGLFC